MSPGVEEIRAFLESARARAGAAPEWVQRLVASIVADVDLQAALERDDAIGARVALSAVAYRLFHPNYPTALRISFAVLGIQLP